jgi:hypothetical protein
MSIFNNEDQQKLSIQVLEEFSEIRKQISNLQNSIEDIKIRNQETKDSINKTLNLIIENQNIIDQKLKLYKSDYIEPTYNNALNTVQWVYDIKEKIGKM